jgi:peptide-methionine (S)-S-oxide reductase
MSDKKIFTRRGFMSKANAYKFYRKSCGRDERIKKLWGNRGYFGVIKNK